VEFVRFWMERKEGREVMIGGMIRETMKSG